MCENFQVTFRLEWFLCDVLYVYTLPVFLPGHCIFSQYVFAMCVAYCLVCVSAHVTHVANVRAQKTCIPHIVRECVWLWPPVSRLHGRIYRHLHASRRNHIYIEE
jgi:hypothetical protein